MPLADPEERLWQLVEASFVLDELDEESQRRHRLLLDRDVRHVFRVLADLGAVEVTGVERVTDAYGSPVERGTLPHDPVAHTYTSAGTKTVTLTVGESTATEQVTVAEPEPLRALLAKAGHATDFKALTETLREQKAAARRAAHEHFAKFGL